MNTLNFAQFLSTQPIVTLSTVGVDSLPYSAIIYLFAVDDRCYFVTKRDTQKFRNLSANPAVAIAAYDANTLSSLQMTGEASEVEDEAIIAEVKRQLAHVYTKSPGILPPIAQLEAGDVVFVGIEPTHARIGNFDRKDGDEEVYHDATE